MKFSERQGYAQVRSKFQIEEIDNSLANAIWNEIYLIFLTDSSSDKLIKSEFGNFLSSEYVRRKIWKDFFNYSLDELLSKASPKNAIIVDVKAFILHANSAGMWFGVYDLLEFLAEIDIKPDIEYTDRINACLRNILQGIA